MSVLAVALVILLYNVESQSYNNVYMTDCGGQSGCGTVNGCRWVSNGVAPSEGMYGVSCTCPGGNNAITEVCTYDGHTIYKCTNGDPSCTAPCQKEICITHGSKKATAEIVSACPKYHPQNAEQCCKHKNDAYCTCIIRNTIDCSQVVYNEDGGANANVDITSGACSGDQQKRGFNISSRLIT